MNTCDRCRYWRPPSAATYALLEDPDDAVGECERVHERGALAITQCALHGGRAMLHTWPKFGCVEFKPRAKRSGLGE